jgi:hypothetical protein
LKIHDGFAEWRETSNVTSHADAVLKGESPESLAVLKVPPAVQPA